MPSSAELGPQPDSISSFNQLSGVPTDENDDENLSMGDLIRDELDKMFYKVMGTAAEQESFDPSPGVPEADVNPAETIDNVTELQPQQRGEVVGGTVVEIADIIELEVPLAAETEAPAEIEPDKAAVNGLARQLRVLQEAA